MKKSLLALAVLGAFAGVASAQSSVTIYGVLDQGVQKSNGGTAFSNGPGASKAWTLAQSTTSRLGFRGNEDLGGGLSAQFWIEHRFNPDTGAQNAAGSFWNGRSFVQLTSATAGSIYLGRDYTPAFWVQLKSDPFGNDGVGQFGVPITFAGHYTPDQAAGLTSVPQAAWPAGPSARASNSVGYKTPNWGGFTAQVAVSASETTGQGRGTGLNAEYNAGPLYVGLGAERIYNGASDDRGVINVAVHYNFGVIKPIVYFAKAKAGTGAAEDNKTLLLAATAPLGNGVVKFGVSKTDFEFGQDYKKLGLGYNYFLSKRTNIYADLGVSKGRISSAVATRDIEGTRNTSYALGVRHTF